MRFDSCIQNTVRWSRSSGVSSGDRCRLGGVRERLYFLFRLLSRLLDRWRRCRERERVRERDERLWLLRRLFRSRSRSTLRLDLRRRCSFVMRSLSPPPPPPFSFDLLRLAFFECERDLDRFLCFLSPLRLRLRSFRLFLLDSLLENKEFILKTPTYRSIRPVVIYFDFVFSLLLMFSSDLAVFSLSSPGGLWESMHSWLASELPLVWVLLSLRVSSYF